MPGQGFGKARRISKFYRALVRGILEYDEILIEQPIGMVQYPGVAKGLYVASSSGKPAMSKVQVLERDTQQNRTVVQVEIHSGRPHQIRIHLAFIGHPLVGDPLYQGGGQPNLLETETIEDSFAEDGGYQKPERPLPGDCGYYLHARRLVLCHPSMEKMIEIIAPLPSILQTRQESNQIRAAEGMLTYEMAS
ncbi:RNA pseudouridine synthase 5-like [Dendrobium catenatum]|uniref:RNA pseudouridine synthase 5 n=1 Tax=Dendrobium catenatum TaxID=906689 RepID=A0A2I0WMG5_9ASPA|nr:RNA pseudouridine synthase 5-like [Dendrobium catenatum]PKU76855.1 RNA pseudouridine synthase 5 [Dendrobium catenatum]